MRPVCAVCARAEARYTCPRCQIAYCSLECYQAHGDKCTESFYKSQVEEELRSHKVSDEEKRHLEKVMASLARLDAPSDDEEAEDEEDASEHRLEILAQLAASGELCLEDLTEEEAESFRAALKSGDLGRALGPWEPWWQKVAAVDLCSLDEDDIPGVEGDDALHQNPPAHICCSLDGSRQAHPSVVFTMLEALFAYVHTLRAFNGDWRWDPLQAAAHMFHLGKGIWAHQVHESATSTLQALWQSAATLPGGGFGTTFDQHCVGDVAALLSRGVGSCARALREAADVATAAAEAATQEDSKARGAARLRRGAKKLEFLTSFAWHHLEALGPDLAEQVRALEEVLQGLGRKSEEAAKRKASQTDGIALPLRC